MLAYTVAGRAIGFALEQPFHVVELACSASGIVKQLEYKQLIYFVTIARSASGILK
ncbi:MAG: hypothetical protein LBJ00_16580 [Planctomycetaceae bacterium]|nr:hypothetical protein [Planctomycetaceae bacterium]